MNGYSYIEDLNIYDNLAGNLILFIYIFSIIYVFIFTNQGGNLFQASYINKLTVLRGLFSRNSALSWLTLLKDQPNNNFLDLLYSIISTYINYLQINFLENEASK